MKEKIIRGCGTRKPGGAYLVTNIGTEGIPIDLFLLDPPWIPMDDEGNPKYPPKIGMDIIEFNNSSVVLDWIGEEYYSYFPDFWEEVRRYGLSRRVAKTTDFSKLSQGTSIIGFHNKGIPKIDDISYNNLMTGMYEMNTGMDGCPFDKDILEHKCVSALWQLVDEVTSNYRLHPVKLPRKAEHPQSYYYAASIPADWVPNIEWIPAGMYQLPLHKIEVIADTIGGEHELTYDIIKSSGTTLPVEVVDE